MAALDLTNTWFVKSYRKSPEEWFVVPLIVGTSMVYGSLPSVGIGLCASTLIFVASFQQAGVVKFVASGLTLRSTIERNCEDNMWLDENGGLIHIFVLQNYLFFGNASTCLGYFESIFDDERDLSDERPTPKYVILDLSIMTGIDASAIDVLADISSLCKENRCKIIFTGIPQMMGPSLERGGVRPSASNRHLSIELDLEAALGKAEDELLKYVGHKEEISIAASNRLRHIRRVSMIDHGLRHALREIDKQHDLQTAKHLEELEKFTTPLELDVDVEFCSRPGLYFVESGLIKYEYDASTTVRRTIDNTALFDQTGVRADSGHYKLKKDQGNMPPNKVFRLARIGPG
jgi:MFS superfamily sulfate permease-like transporter